jgi:hypothetical protein
MPSVDAVYDIGSPTARIDTVYATYFVGNGSQLTGIAQTYSNANVAAYLPTYSGNIGAGNINATGRISTTGNVVGNFLFGDGGFLTNVTVSSNVAATQLANGSTVLSIAGSGGNIVATVGGVSNVVVIGTQQATFSGNILPVSNVTQSLGSPTKAWKDLYLSNSTLYLNDVAISSSSNSVIFTTAAGN